MLPALQSPENANDEILCRETCGGFFILGLVYKMAGIVRIAKYQQRMPQPSGSIVSIDFINKIYVITAEENESNFK